MKAFFLFAYVLYSNVYALNLKPGSYSCEYKYQDSDKENEQKKTRIKIIDDEKMHLIEMEAEVTDNHSNDPHLEFMPFLELPKKDHVTKNVEQIIGFDSILIKRHFETKKFLYMKYDFFGHWFTRTEEKLTIKIKKNNKIKIRMKSKDQIEKFSSETNLLCKLEV